MSSCGHDPRETCGCCEGVHVVTPVPIYNRPGLDTLAYRAGSHGRLLATMVARLSSAALPALKGLRTRDGDDPSIAFLDGWATVADVLTFYQERIANEGFLRTATERRSVLELARLIGYTPRPGLSASAFVAYTIESDHPVTIPVGSRVQSVPGPGELPQTFETSDPIVATGAYSALPVRQTRPQDVVPTAFAQLKRVVVEAPPIAGVKRSDVLRAHAPSLPTAVVLFEATQVDTDSVQQTTTVSLALRHSNVLAATTAPGGGDFYAGLKQQYASHEAFGVPQSSTAAEAVALLNSLGSEGNDDAETVSKLRDLYSLASELGDERLAAWLGLLVEALTPSAVAVMAQQDDDSDQTTPKTKNKTRLGQLVDALRKPPSIPPSSDRDLQRDVGALYATNGGGVSQLLGELVPAVKHLLAPAVTNSTQPSLDPVTFERLAVDAALFGHQAPLFPIYDDGEVQGYVDPMVTDLLVKPPSGGGGSGGGGTIPIVATTSGTESQPPAIAQFTPPTYTPGNTLFLDAVYEGIQPGQDVLLVNAELTPQVASRRVDKVETVSVSALGVTARVTKLTLSQAWPSVDSGSVNPSLATVVRRTQVLAQPEPLTLAEESMDGEDVEGALVELAGLHLGLAPGRFAIVSGERTDPEIRAVQKSSPTDDPGNGGTGVHSAELAMIAAVEHRVATRPGGTALPGDSVHTFLRLAEPLAYRYRRPTVVVHGNVVKATHGSTSPEVLGAGDATKTFQRFSLKQPPLTYLPAPTAVGAKSTLEVRVNDVRWHEVDDLVTAGPNDRSFFVRTDDDGKTAVVFGDGARGARLPTGLENVRAVYRSGLGKAGNVGANQISVAVSRPLGVKEVVNPLPATGGADRETRDQARRNAPIAIQALDRLVSVQDYADFARTFAGIGKASARELSDGRREVVHVTIAGVDDEPIAPTSDLVKNLYRALVELGDPFIPLELAIRTLRVLVVDAAVRVHPDHKWDTVEPVIRHAMRKAFGPERRELGQDVVLAEVLSAMQAVPGVVYVHLRILDDLDETQLAYSDPAASLTLRPRVRARLARRADSEGAGGGITPAELVILPPRVHDTLILSELP